eukprot:14586-Heterococcus_DN1.PRE.2
MSDAKLQRLQHLLMLADTLAVVADIACSLLITLAQCSIQLSTMTTSPHLDDMLHSTHRTNFKLPTLTITPITTASTNKVFAC